MAKKPQKVILSTDEDDIRGEEGEAMQRRVVGPAAVLLTALAVFLVAKGAVAKEHLFEAMGMAKVAGQKAPDFTLSGVDGTQVSLQQYKGKVIFLNFWATWCIPCREEMPALEKLHHTYRAQDLVVLAIDLKESPEQVKAFFEKHALSFPSVIDPNGAVFRAYSVTGMPTTYLIGRDGTILARGIGGRDWTRAEAHELIRELVQKTPVASGASSGTSQ
jgi:cytochrome c biogenesis protein CcmG/thiol:disulfide interchange protein DsbE